MPRRRGKMVPGMFLSGRLRRHGFLQLEVLWGITIIGMLLGLFTVVTIRQDKVERQLAARRALVRQTEVALLTLQTGGKITDDSVSIKLLDTPSSVTGFRWVEVSMAEKTKPLSLIGLVPEKSLPAEDVLHEKH